MPPEVVVFVVVAMLYLRALVYLKVHALQVIDGLMLCDCLIDTLIKSRLDFIYWTTLTIYYKIHSKFMNYFNFF